MNASHILKCFAEILVLMTVSVALVIPIITRAQEAPQTFTLTLADYRFSPPEGAGAYTFCCNKNYPS